MMRINIAICDDEQKSLQMIQKELYHIADKLKIEIETYAYKEGKKVLDLIYNEKEDFDVLFLDIDMPDVSGLEVAKKLRQKHLDIILIFISAYEQYVFESIEYNPFRYIRKNRIEKELMPCLKAAYQRLEEMQDSYMIVKLTEKSEALIAGQETFTMKMAKEPEKEAKTTPKKKVKKTAGLVLNKEQEESFEILRALRAEIAREEKVPPYIVFSDKTLVQMCVEKPTNKNAMLKVSGVGEFKFEKYGERFLEVIRSWT